MLVGLGCGVNAQVVLTGKGDFQTIALAWGLAVAMGIYVAGGVSGAHINPAFTLAVAVKRGFPWGKVVPYVGAQLGGAFTGALVVYFVYRDSFSVMGYGVPWIDRSATAGVFGTYIGAAGTTHNPIGLGTALADQIVGAAFLVLVILAVSDKRNLAPSGNLGALIIGLLVTVIALSFGANYGFAINPARDLGPRLFSFFTHGANVFQATGPNYFWVPIVGPLVGGVAGAFIYDWFVGRLLPGPQVEAGRATNQPAT